MQLLWPRTSIPPELADDEAHVWAVPLDANSTSVKSYETLLSADEQKRASSLKTDELRRRSIVAHGSLRVLLGRYLHAQPEEIAFTFEHRGKPQIVGDDGPSTLKFNLTHSADIALVAVTSGCEIGVDVERIREIKKVEQLASRYFHTGEVADVISATNDQSSAFLKIWTAKEAVLKAFGSGIMECLDHFQVPPHDQAEGWVDVSAIPNFANPAQCWVTRLAPGENYEAAVAFLGPQRRVRGLVFDA